MNMRKANKVRTILIRAFGVLAIPVALNAVVGMARVADLDGSGQTAASDGQELSGAERVFRSDWGSTNPEVYARIAHAFDTEAMDGAELMSVECRSTLCRVVYEAKPDMPVNQILPRQLADSFNTVITVHSGRTTDNETLVYIDVPSNT
jgi:hypothetical protein